MTNRRNFIRNASLLVAAGMLVKPSFAGIAAAPKSKKKIGLQLYSLRDDMGKDPRGTLQKVGKMGYTTLETASYGDGKIYGFEPKEFKQYVKDLGMKATGAHLGGPNYTRETHDKAMDWWKKAIEDHKTAGITYLVKPSMPIPNNLKDLQMWCDFYNILGQEVSKNGMKFGFHNHDGEFKIIEDKIMYDFMIQNTVPKYVLFEMDVYWVKRGGHEPVDYLTKYPGRFPILHIKDEKEIGASGNIDFKPIFDLAYANKMKEFYVEVEQYNFAPAESVQKSYDFLAAASYVK